MKEGETKYSSNEKIIKTHQIGKDSYPVIFRKVTTRQGSENLPKMNERFKYAWVESLNLGKFTHCTGANRDTSKENCYCACGILMELVREYLNEKYHDGEEYYKWDEEHPGRTPVLFNSKGSIPHDVAGIAGLLDCPVLITEDDNFNGLITLNDDQQMPFKEMAKLIMRSL